MEWRHVKELARERSLPRATRVDVAALYASRAWRRKPHAIRVGRGCVYVDPATFDTDWETWRVIFSPKYRMYDGDYDDAVVVDVGAHKGYFGAFAFAEGARTVLSYEPQSRNFELLKRAAESLDDPGVWIVRRAAVGSKDRQDTLHIRPGSWSHSLVAPPGRGARSEPVDVCAMATVLDAARQASGRRVIVKIDAEGAECEIVLGTDVIQWRLVDELLLEHHDFAPCTMADLTVHLESAGLAHRERRHDEVDRFSRLP